MSDIEITAPAREVDASRDRPRHRAFARARWVLTIIVLATGGALALATPRARDAPVASANDDRVIDRGVGRRALSVYYNRKIAGGQQLSMQHGASARPGRARDSREANWVGDEINRHVKLNADAGGPETPEIEVGSSKSEFGGMDNNQDAATEDYILRRRRRKRRAERNKQAENEHQIIKSTPAADDNDDAMQSARETLGVTEGATKREITKAFYKQARLHHTDKVGPAGKEKMQEINAAKDLLLTASDNSDSD
jgi:hypothetical protein